MKAEGCSSDVTTFPHSGILSRGAEIQSKGSLLDLLLYIFSEIETLDICENWANLVCFE